MSQNATERTVECADDSNDSFKAEGVWSCVNIDLPPRTSKEEAEQASYEHALLTPVVLIVFLQVVYAAI